MKFQAYWLHISGEVVPVPLIHIIEVINNPEKFNYTSDQIEDVFKRHKEPMGHEGKARAEIMSDLIKNHGWIRFRFTPKKDLWTIELNTMTTEIMQQIKELFKQPDVVGKSINAEVKINELFHVGGMKQTILSMNELL